MHLLQDADVRNKKVFLRVDFNVPMEGGKITDNNRIKSVLPTIKYLVGQKAKIVIGTHLGRPDGKKSEETSIAPIAKELQRILNLKVTMAPGIFEPEVQKLVDDLQYGGIIVLENLRWDKREEENDAGFAQDLARYAEVYVNDAFAVSHRANASIEAITKYLPSYAGVLLQEEVESLSKLTEAPRMPFVLVIGGVKIKDKAGMIDKLAPKASRVIVGGGVANTFLKARGDDIGQSVFDEEMVDKCKEMLKKYDKKIILPVDCEKEEVEDGFKILDIGPQTAEQFCEEIKKAKTVFWNGCMGYVEDKKHDVGTRRIADALSLVSGTTIVAGGDTVGYLLHEKLGKGITFLSTGGGAALEFLAGENLPGLSALN